MKKRKGFTFIEVMIALILLMVGIVFLIDLFPLALKSFKNSKDVTVSTFILQEKMEEIRNMPFGQAVPQGSFLDSANPQYRYNIASGDWGYNEDYEEISVRVGKNKDGMIGKVYAQASATRPKTPKGDMAVLNIPAFSGGYNKNMLIFVAVPSQKEVYYSAAMAVSSIGNPGNIWRPLPGTHPSGGNGEWCPDKIDVAPYYVSSGSAAGPSANLVAINVTLAWVYVTDTKNRCIWSALLRLNMSPNPYQYIDLTYMLNWTPVKDTFPPGFGQ